MSLGTPWENTKETAKAYVLSIRGIMDMSDGEVAFDTEDCPDFNLDRRLVGGLQNLLALHRDKEAPLHVNLKREVTAIREVISGVVTAAQAFMGEERYRLFENAVNEVLEGFSIELLPQPQTLAPQETAPLQIEVDKKGQTSFLPELTQ